MTAIAELRAVKASVHRRLASRNDLVDLVGEPQPLRAELAVLVHAEAPLLPEPAVDQLVRELAAEMLGFGALEPVFADETVTEVMVNGPGSAFVERNGRLEAVDLHLDAAEIMRIVERVIAPLGLRLDRAAPIVDARLPDGSRLHAVIPPLAVDGPCVTIRRFRTRHVTLDEFAVHPPAAAFLEWAVVAGWNVLVSGGTGSGKTTLLNALSASIPGGERIVTIEETAELRLRQPHVVRLEARPANAEGAGAVGVRDLVRAALRMRPDRLVVGEVRGGEAFDMINALNTGHDGSLSTVHANSPVDALTRIETLAMLAGTGLPVDAVRRHVNGCVDLVVQVARGRDGSRVVQSIDEVVPANRPAVRPLFRGPGLAAIAIPQRRARRYDAPMARTEWFGC